MAITLSRKEIAKYNCENKIAKHCKVYRTSGDSIWTANQEHEIRLIPDTKRNVRHVVTAKNPIYEGSESEARFLSKIEDRIKIIKKKFSNPAEMKRNISHMPEDAQDFFDLIRVDVTRRTLARADIVPFICRVESNADFTNPLDSQWLLEYAAPFKKFEGKGDKVNLVQIKTGEKESIYFTFWGVGFQQDLYNMLFNQIFSMGRVDDAVARGYVARKNDTVISQIINFAYPAEKQVAAASSGSVEQNYYDTLNNAIEALGLLKDPQTNREIDILSGLALLCHSTKVRTINRVINGNIQNGDEIRNLTPLTEIAQIIPYNGDTITYGEEVIDYPGIAKDKAYLFVPRSAFWYLLKRDLTRETGPGDVFSFSSDRDAWYFVDAIWATQFFGGDTGGTTTTKEQGYIVEIALPDNVAS